MNSKGLLLVWSGWMARLLLAISFAAIGVASGAEATEFTNQLSIRLGVPLPADAKVVNVATNVGIEPLGRRTNSVHEWFAVVTMSPTNAIEYATALKSVKRDHSFQRLASVDKNSTFVFGSIPGPHKIPVSISKWWGEPKSETMIRLDEFKMVSPNGAAPRGSIMIFMSTEKGKLWIWSYQYFKEHPFPGSG